ncbi:hypothetical protein JOC34_003304 [Virgibacillus halotolerans]|uniref:hypothetical protein n=1 Tax=Virgibacillus halotolerans TaxID=1071053 RepID=UPI0019606EB4|nr:hypothetical protein [Virgibacillus halotolerans]MBM7600890.1 hypothetical protein [Virgibacillus halotolerans]
MAAARILIMAVGFIVFFVISDLPKSHKKKMISEMISQLINFVIYIWLGKIILDLALFVKDPLAILAYPSNAHAFYLAVLFSVLTLAYKQFYRKVDMVSFIPACIPVFLSASFVYEFIQFVWYDHTYAIGNLILLTVLIIVGLLIRDRIRSTIVTTIMIIGWSTGMLLLTFILPLTTVFGYIMDSWFIGLLLITNIILLTINQRKRVT